MQEECRGRTLQVIGMYRTDITINGNVPALYIPLTCSVCPITFILLVMSIPVHSSNHMLNFNLVTDRRTE